MVRLRKDIKFIRKGAFSQPDDREQDILVDEAIELTGDETAKNYPKLLRRVAVYRPYDSSRRKSGQLTDSSAEKEHTIELITNNAYWEADTISALYKSRWQIESFFKTIKQHLRIKTFIRIHLMSYIDLWAWVNQLSDKAHSPPKFTQI